MGFFGCDSSPAADAVNGVSLKTIHRHQCAICPLNPKTGDRRAEPLQNPFMPASGSAEPRVYMLGEAPGAEEDAKGYQFAGRAGELLWFRAPYMRDWLDQIRWNNVVRCRPPDNRDPTQFEIECDRPAVTADIERTQPEAIFGFGNIALNWAVPNLRQHGGITKWRGRRLPVRIGAHVCWYFPLAHPAWIARARCFEPHSRDEYPSDLEFAFEYDLKRAFAAVARGLPPPILVTAADMLRDVDYVTGCRAGDLDRVLTFIGECSSEQLVGIDYETNMLRPYNQGAHISTVALAHDRAALAWPLYHPGSGWEPSQREIIQNTFANFLHKAPCAKISFSLPFELEWSAYFHGPECLYSGRWEDAQGQAYVLDERRDTMSLDFHMRLEFGLDFKAISGDIDRARIDDQPVDAVLRYNALDAAAHRMLYIRQERRIEAERLTAVYAHQRRRAAAVVGTQLLGLPVDQPAVEKFIGKYEQQLGKAEARLFAMPEVKAFARTGNRGKPFAPGSPRQVAKLLRSLGFHEIETTGEAALAALNHPVADAVVAWRKPSKLLSTYLYPCRYDYERSAVMDDGLLHPSYNLCKVVTFRTSADSPSIQNFPKRDSATVEIRSVIRAAHDRAAGDGADIRVVAFDYAGIQARNVAMESRDEALVDAFWHRYDIHADWRDRIATWCPDWMSGDADPKAYRHLAKNRFVFPSFFGARPAKLAAGLGIDEMAAAGLLEQFWDAFPGVTAWHQRQLAAYRRHGYVTGLSGFRRRAPCSHNEIINTPIQSDEALIVITAMCELAELEEPRFQPAMEIHDDLTFLWPYKDIERNAGVVLDHMLHTPYQWAHIVPIEVEMSVGRDWRALEAAGAYASDTWDGSVSL